MDWVIWATITTNESQFVYMPQSIFNIGTRANINHHIEKKPGNHISLIWRSAYIIYKNSSHTFLLSQDSYWSDMTKIFIFHRDLIPQPIKIHGFERVFSLFLVLWQTARTVTHRVTIDHICRSLVRSVEGVEADILISYGRDRSVCNTSSLGAFRSIPGAVHPLDEDREKAFQRTFCPVAF